MADQYTPKYRSNQKRKRGRRSSSSSSLVVSLVAIMALLVLFSLGIRMLLGTPEPEPVQMEEPSEKTGFFQTISGWFSSKETEPTETEPPELPEPEHVVSQARISVTGDILMHLPVINTGLMNGGSYNFNSIFRYLMPYTTDTDYAIANLETTLCGTDAGYKYSGYPAFNCPDEIVDALKHAGFDMLLTANNHCYDTSEYGFLRTVNTIRSLGLTALGTRSAETDPKFHVEEINGIKIGMVCYTYQGQPEKPRDGVVYMNQNALSGVCGPLVNSFLPGSLDSFYLEIRQCLADMKAAGAEATMLFIHWGAEYQTVPSAEQREMAQQLCDLGFDVIVGGHPHVIQPVELLTSRVNPDQKTVCLYSTGNAVSNQRIAEMNLKTGHTEDALLFTAEFCKYSDGTVCLQDVDLLPCWVDMTYAAGRKEYHILPLDPATRDQWKELYTLDSGTISNAEKSYERTAELTDAGMTQAKQYLAARKEQREADYLAAVTPTQDAA